LNIVSPELEATSEKARADKIATGYSALGITVTARQIEELDELAVDNDFSKWPGAVKDILEKSGQFRDVKIILGGHGVTARVRIRD
jgi:hypothetical protein